MWATQQNTRVTTSTILVARSQTIVCNTYDHTEALLLPVRLTHGRFTIADYYTDALLLLIATRTLYYFYRQNRSNNLPDEGAGGEGAGRCGTAHGVPPPQRLLVALPHHPHPQGATSRNFDIGCVCVTYIYTLKHTYLHVYIYIYRERHIERETE